MNCKTNADIMMQFLNKKECKGTTFLLLILKKTASNTP